MTATGTFAAERSIEFPALAALAPAHEGGAWRDSLSLIERSVLFTRRIVHAGDTVYRGGQSFACLHIINSGQFKTVNCATDGRGQVVGLHFKGDWLGFDGIAEGHHGCDASALDTGEIWTVGYHEVLEARARAPELMHLMHAAMSRQISRQNDLLLALGTMPADARVASFLADWATALSDRGLRTDQIKLHMTRAEIGNYLGMTLETVSRSMRRIVQSGVIRFDERGRRDISIPSMQALQEFILKTTEGAKGARASVPCSRAGGATGR